jgi:hypothetical protein
MRCSNCLLCYPYVVALKAQRSLPSPRGTRPDTTTHTPPFHAPFHWLGGQRHAHEANGARRAVQKGETAPALSLWQWGGEGEERGGALPEAEVSGGRLPQRPPALEQAQ